MKKYQIIYKIKMHFKRGLTPLLCALTIFNLVSINVSASNFLLSFPFSEPLVNEHNGYVVVSRDDDVYNILWWNFNPVVPISSSSVESGIYVNCFLNDDSGANFLYLEFDSSYSGFLSVYHWSSYSESISLLDSYYYDVGSNIHVTSIRLNAVPNYFYAKGPYVYLNSDGTLTDLDFNILWSESDAIYDSLSSINNALWAIHNSINPSIPSGSIEDVSKNDISNVTNKESQILNTSNIDTSALNVQLNSNVLASTMSLVDSLVTSNPKIATMSFTLMTLAVVAFVLRR